MESLAYASLPLLVADLADEESRDFLHGVALAEQVALVPLLAAPADRSTHLLEVYSPESKEPLRLLADPVGPPTHDGFPLRLKVQEALNPKKEVAPAAAESAVVRVTGDKRPPTLRAKHETNHALSERHTHDLEGVVATNKQEPSDLIGRQIAGGKLQIESLIGGGGIGAVYRAQHRELRMPVAVKVLHESYQMDADFGRRFHAEALAASRLDHPNVTRVLDFGQEPDGMLYLVMEFLDGTGLRSVLDTEKRLGTDRIVKLLSQVCAGLAHAHARSIVHKDIKPENLVIIQGLDDDGHAMEIVKVCDFGIAQGAVAEETRRFQGTPEYMSPEQCLSEELDARSDVYSCGIVLYELATGDVPFTDEEVGRVVWCHLHQPPDPPTSRAVVDPRLERVILRALAKDKNDRYPTMRDLRAALRGLLEKPPTPLSGRYELKLGNVAIPSLPKRPASSQRNAAAVAPAPAAPAAPAPTRARAEDDSSEWLVHGGGYEIISSSNTATGGTAPPTTPRSELMHDPISFMRRLVSTTEPRAFAELVLPLEEAIRQLVQSLQVETLWRLASTLDVLATEGPEVSGSRAQMSKAVLRILRDPNTLAPIAQRVLATPDSAGERLLIAAGSFGAHALYSARVRASEPEARKRFIDALRAIGPAGLPILRGGLERLADRLGAPGASHIAEDLLVSIPAVPDDALGALVAAYARCNNPALARAAVMVLPKVWRERSRAIILGLVEHPNAHVVSAALYALGELGVSDDITPKRIAGVLDRATFKSVRLAAVRVMVQGRGDARRVGAELIEERLRATKQPQTSDDAEVALNLARGLITIVDERDRSAAHATVDEASKEWPRDLRARAILTEID